jgi:hypothetical protein
MMRWGSGWKDIAASAAVTIVGGFVVSKVSPVGAKAFVIGAGGVTLLKAFRMIVRGRGAFSLKDEEIFGDVDDIMQDDEEIFGQDDEEIFGFDDTEEIIRPTAAIEEFVE